MLKREEILQIEYQKNLNSSINFLISTIATTYPGIIENNEAGNEERFAMAEHMIRRFFSSSSAQAADGGALGLFVRIFEITPDEIAKIIKQACEDLQKNDVPEEEIAITATFIWFVNASKQYGDYFTEFSYLIYAMSDAARDDERLKQDGASELKKVATRKPAIGFLAKLFHIL